LYILSNILTVKQQNI